MRRHDFRTITLAVALTCILPMQALAITDANGDLSMEDANVGFEALYPTSGTTGANSGGYDLFTATLNGLGLRDDATGDNDGNSNDERCIPDKEAEIKEAMAGLTILNALGTACNVAPENIDIPCFIALTIVATALEAASIADAQCSLQDALVDAAEIEATYENLRLDISADLEEYLNECEKIVSLRLPIEFGGRAEEVQHLVLTRIVQVMELGGFPDAVNLAQAEYGAGQSDFGMQKYRDAHTHFCTAYNILVDTEM